MELAQHSTTLRGSQNPGRDQRAERRRVRGSFLVALLQIRHYYIKTIRQSSHNQNRRIRYMFKIMHHDTCVAVTETINEAMTVVRSLEAGLDRLKQHSPYTILRAE